MRSHSGNRFLFLEWVYYNGGVMKIVVQNEKTVNNPLVIHLGSFTLFAGENNSGKTQIITELGKHLASKNKNVVRIPAEKVLLANEVKTGTAKDEFRVNLEKLISLSVTDESFAIDDKIGDIELELPKLFQEYGVENIEVNVTKGAPTNDDYEKVCRELYIKKALDSITIHDTLSDAESISLEDAGQGAERLVIVSLIRYISDKISDKASESYLIIEEPEIYLHPKLKRSFYEALKTISQGVKVVVTTHDPYFISLRGDEMVYKVSRDTDGNTMVEKMKENSGFLNDSNAEINYLIFGVPSFDYCLSLYSKIEAVLGPVKNAEHNKEISLNNKKVVTLRDFRNQIAHDVVSDPDKKDGGDRVVIGLEDVRDEVNMRKFIEECHALLTPFK